MNIDELTLKQIKQAYDYLQAITQADQRINNNAAQADIASSMIGKYCIVRTYSAGVHTGVLNKRNGTEAVLHDSRRIWAWSGAVTLSQLARYGTSAPDECKFSAPVESILLTECIEIIPAYGEAIKSIQSVKNWTK